jgi:microfibrillar-associated protein 1
MEAWKLREITRLRRDAEEREQHMTEQAEIQRRRNLTDEQRRNEDEASGRFEVKEKEKIKFLQKYYHKGAFYMDDGTVKQDDDVRRKEYNAPTLGDHTDKEKLPQIMQVKNFGKRGRTKYTHLVDQDTTLKDNQRLNIRPDKHILEKYNSRMSGMQ